MDTRIGTTQQYAVKQTLRSVRAQVHVGRTLSIIRTVSQYGSGQVGKGTATTNGIKEKREV